jgi:D-glycero-D-manno-heptose 1,7-bisphosphate phosphatase
VTTRAAVFLDRDGTIVHDVYYLARPDQLALMAGAVDAMHRMAAAGLALVVVTNQSGIGRGLFSEADFAQITARLDNMLATEGITLLATYHCPDAPDVPTHISCRKPGTSMYERASRDHNLDLAASFYVGDKWRDVSPAVTLGATGILVPTPDTAFSDMQRAKDNAILATTLGAATDRILRFHAQRG